MAFPQALLLMVMTLWGVALIISLLLSMYAVLADVVCSSKGDLADDNSCRSTMKIREVYDVSRRVVVASSLVAIVCGALIALYLVTTA